MASLLFKDFEKNYLLKTLSIDLLQQLELICLLNFINTSINNNLLKKKKKSPVSFIIFSSSDKNESGGCAEKLEQNLAFLLKLLTN